MINAYWKQRSTELLIEYITHSQ